MRNLIIQTYIKDDINRGKKHTYVPNPTLERYSRHSVEMYADLVGADYEFCTTPADWYDDYPGAHWHRMVMFDRSEYDNVLYLDCDVIVNSMMFYPEHLMTSNGPMTLGPMPENIFEQRGVGSALIHPGSEKKIGWAGGINCGVTKWTKEECEIMRKYIHGFYQPKTNQEAINNCYRIHIGKFDYLFYRWNVTHFPTSPLVGGTNFRHYPGAQRDTLDTDVIYNLWKARLG